MAQRAFHLIPPSPDVQQPIEVVSAGLSAEGEHPHFRLAALPEDVTSEVEIVALSLADQERPFRVGELPPDVTQPVEVVAQATAASEGNFRLGELPPDVRQPVEVVAQAIVGEVAASTAVEAVHSLETPVPVSLDNQEMYQIIRAVASGISGDDLYEYVDASQPQEHGLRVGLVGFSQARGELGVLLRAMRRRDPSLFAVAMGPESQELIRITNAETHEDRLEPVNNVPLWHPQWQNTFRLAGQQEKFRAAQNEISIENQFKPMLAAARQLGLYSDRGLALLYNRVVALGPEEGVSWIHQRLPDIGTEPERLARLIRNAGPEEDKLRQLYDHPLLTGAIFRL